jgi:hypothetical protein
MDELLLEVNPVQEGVIVQLDLGFEGDKALNHDFSVFNSSHPR